MLGTGVPERDELVSRRLVIPRSLGAMRVYLAGPPFADEYRRRARLVGRPAGSRSTRCAGTSAGTEGHEQEIVEGDLADIDSCDAVLAAFTAPDEGTAMEAWYAHGAGTRIVAYTGGTPVHPWTRFVAAAVCADLEDAVAALRPE